MNNKTRNTILAILVFSVFILATPIMVEYDNKLLRNQYNLNETDVTEFVDDTGVVYLKYKTSITPKLDSKGNVIIRKGVK